MNRVAHYLNDRADAQSRSVDEVQVRIAGPRTVENPPPRDRAFLSELYEASPSISESIIMSLSLHWGKRQ